ncbi:flavin-containing monooxygenase [Gordonia alkanivorans]|uniref:4-hydroxyacetophenone monooxygenase n=1 Tax=Gordonia alkanivorans CGMCC 6845 TaxID=1423140 RepID=W9D8S4_9ACTN|nr:NAD(P)/FAD-dependent oxidoreductase [Gordonia alkanivorans]ETA04714.1 4-hydroxyacetophenone monooxygenase [Gordonia alkanivorans CGMCC 6845]MDH3009359.1 NAD(P)/FAD-dependent oxidoreductase [Gordonia alkanivorans]MDH3012557.1 NAD(P)/FAD-dependent oxidoreductase [Gordonia alkanivorans]MDH3017416.1 NAD(P)/FAD-dependent oxidoreductase [Gordonia alkanivorans]MDH3022459.1 NAD(P)/FAD-dependent oxidoreductase [Gordonia alkanivorans]
MTISVAIIGAGFAGIGSAIRLQDKGIDDFVILERDTRVGGTWRDNTYPGAACDIPSRLYSYSFAPNPDWSHTYSRSDEILAYIDDMVDSSNLRSRIRFEHTVNGLQYDAATGEWTIGFAGDRAPLRARHVIMASGPLANASFPDLRGIDDYAGQKIHSARWDHDYDFTGKKVGVIGTGASAVQIVPELVREAASVKVFQRTPGWVLPRVNTETGGIAKRVYRSVPGAQQLARELWFWGHESVALGVVWKTPLTRVVETVSMLHLRAQVKDPWLRRQLTPAYAAGCKRLLMSSDYYPALERDNCKLVTWPIARLARQGIRTVEGVEHQVDCIVFATGFDVSKAGTPFPITGLDGRVLADAWSRGAYAYRSVAVSGYPNLYFTFGPNSGPGHNSALVYMEAQIDFITGAISQTLSQGWKALDVRTDAQDRHNRDIQRRLTATTWNSGCQSWYLTEDGFNATMYPGFATQYLRELRRLDLRDFRILVHDHAGRSAREHAGQPVGAR